MIVGCLGDIDFYVSSFAVRTLRNLQFGGSAKYGTHDRHGQKSLLEFTGLDPDSADFDIDLSADLGTSPKKSIERIRQHEENGDVLSFALGDAVYAGGWVILSHKIKVTHTDVLGNIVFATVSISLKEYVKE